MLKFVVVCALAATCALAAPAQEQQQPSLFEQAYDVYSSCSAEADMAVCLKLKALGYVDRAARSAEIDVVDGFKIVQSEEAKSSRADNARSLNDIESSLPTEVEAREAAVDEALLDRTARFLSTHTVELSLPEEVSRSFGEARGKKKKIVKSLLPILLLLKLKAAALIPIALGGLALLAFKALIIGKIALIISAVIALQKLLGQKHQSYEVVAHEVPHHHDEHHGSGWARSLEMAYSAHKPSSA
ncbi:uncharacterized protein LOC100113774 [Nasonia vitripennis]|uniref:Osiris 9 n=2 Tax=Pteromalinae TaxID=272242 RepID=A0A7M7G4S8_NASVI|nr:uncharacterized protein LOC100113774 [Nasonia vitripennis]OXU24919.1 hypothetical protein TSAR_003503 [Trichomalopsis sarcophagae]